MKPGANVLYPGSLTSAPLGQEAIPYSQLPVWLRSWQSQLESTQSPLNQLMLRLPMALTEDDFLAARRQVVLQRLRDNQRILADAELASVEDLASYQQRFSIMLDRVDVPVLKWDKQEAQDFAAQAYKLETDATSYYKRTGLASAKLIYASVAAMLSDALPNQFYAPASTLEQSADALEEMNNSAQDQQAYYQREANRLATALKELSDA